MSRRSKRRRTPPTDKATRAVAPDRPGPSAFPSADRLGLAILAGALLVGAALRIWLAFHDDGIYWPDEIYQSLEPAHRLVFGNGLIAWEFIEGARSWALPGFVAALLKTSALLGLDQPGQYIVLVRLVLCATGVASAYGSFVLARRLGASTFAAACGAAFFALIGPAIYFAPRSLSETASAFPVVLGLAFALPATASRRDRIIGASLLGVAVLLRLQNGLFCVTLLAVIAARQQWQPLGEATATLGVWAILFGLIDKLTWGSWFHSAVVYYRVNAVMGMQPLTGPSPAGYYAEMLFGSMPAALTCVMVLALVAVPRARGLTFIAAAFLLTHSLIPNKSYRYVYADLPLLGALAAVGLHQITLAFRPRVAQGAAAVMLAAFAWSGATFHRLTFGDVGNFEQTRPLESAYDLGGGLNRLLITAGAQPDLCGLLLTQDQLVWSGGYSYLHRDVPLFAKTSQGVTDESYNYVIADSSEIGGPVVSRDGPRVLARLRGGPCAPTAYDPRLPGADDIHAQLAR